MKYIIVIILISFTIRLFVCESLADTAGEQGFETRDGFKVIGSIEEFRAAMIESGGKIRFKPGVYKVNNAAPDNKTVFFATGSDNYFDMRGVTIEIDTQILADMRGGVHELSVYRIIGDNQIFEGGKFENIGEHPPYRSIQDFSISANGCTFLDCTFIVRGSSPYGYGDLLGKGRDALAPLKKHSGVQIMGENTTFKRCKVENHAFGHCFFVQGGINTTFEDCVAEGAMRPTDEMLAETEGILVDNGFKSVYKNRDGGDQIPAGYMKSLAEDGFRTYSQGGKDNRPTGKVTLINCKAVNVRSGFQIGVTEGETAQITGCHAIECEHGYLLGNNVHVRQSKGDAKYGPLLYLSYMGGGANSDIELEAIGEGSQYRVHYLATIAGKSHKVRIIDKTSVLAGRNLPVMIGYSMPSAANHFSPIFESDTENITLINETSAGVEISRKASNCKVISDVKNSPNDVKNN